MSAKSCFERSNRTKRVFNSVPTADLGRAARQRGAARVAMEGDPPKTVSERMCSDGYRARIYREQDTAHAWRAHETLPHGRRAAP